jgi:hypothetical protein
VSEPTPATPDEASLRIVVKSYRLVKTDAQTGETFEIIEGSEDGAFRVFFRRPGGDPSTYTNLPEPETP